MIPFDIEKYKAGRAALDSTGRRYHYVGQYPLPSRKAPGIMVSLREALACLPREYMEHHQDGSFVGGPGSMDLRSMETVTIRKYGYIVRMGGHLAAGTSLFDTYDAAADHAVGCRQWTPDYMVVKVFSVDIEE